MFSFRKDSVQLDNASSFVDQQTLDTLVYFATNVVIESDSRHEEYEISRCKQAFDKAHASHGIKVLVPLVEISRRILEAGRGFTLLHHYLFGLCKKYSLWRLALPFLTYPALIKSMRKELILQFYLLAFEGAIALQKYTIAFSYLLKSKDLELGSQLHLFQLYKRTIVMGVVFEDKQLLETRQKLKGLWEGNKDSQSYISKHVEMQFYLNLGPWRLLEERQAAILKKSGLQDLYDLGKWTQLRHKVQDEAGCNWRIRTDTIGGALVKDFDTIKGINSVRQVYRYDCRDRMVYFEQGVARQAQVDQLITECVQMQKELNNCKIERKEERFPPSRLLKSYSDNSSRGFRFG